MRPQNWPSYSYSQMQEQDCGALAKCLIPIWELLKTEKRVHLCNVNKTSRIEDCSAMLGSECDS